MEDTNFILRLLDEVLSGIQGENKLVFLLLSITILMSLVQLIKIVNNRLIIWFSVFEVQNKVSKHLYNNILQANTCQCDLIVKTLVTEKEFNSRKNILNRLNKNRPKKSRKQKNKKKK